MCEHLNTTYDRISNFDVNPISAFTRIGRTAVSRLGCSRSYGKVTTIMKERNISPCWWTNSVGSSERWLPFHIPRPKTVCFIFSDRLWKSRTRVFVLFARTELNPALPPLCMQAGNYFFRANHYPYLTSAWLCKGCFPGDLWW